MDFKHSRVLQTIQYTSIKLSIKLQLFFGSMERKLLIMFNSRQKHDCMISLGAGAVLRNSIMPLSEQFICSVLLCDIKMNNLQ